MIGLNDHDIDQLFRSAADKSQVSYQDAYWEEMEALLNNKKTAKRGFLWWLLPVTIIAVSLLSYILFLSDSDINRSTVVARQSTANAAIDKLEKSTDGSKLNVSSNAENEIDISSNSYSQQMQNLKVDGREISNRKKFVADANRNYRTADILDGQQLLYKIDERTDGEKQLPLVAIDNRVGNILQDEVQQKGFSNLVVEQFGNAKDQDNNLELANNAVSETLAVEESYGISESMAAVNVKNIDDDLLMKRKWGYFVGASTGAGMGYVKGQDFSPTIQYQFFIGMDYTKSNQRISAAFGFRQQIVDINYFYSRQYYTYDVFYLNQAVKYDRLNSLDLTIDYRFTMRRSSIGARIIPFYLMGVRSRVENSKGSELVVGMTSQYVEYVQTGFVRTSNVNSFGLDAGFSYQFAIRPSLLFDFSATTRINMLLQEQSLIGTINRFPLRLNIGVIKRF